jgi:SAM-dependent methyltransferase
MEQLPLDFVRCIGCGHVFNESFDYKKVPYSDKPNLMFNKGTLWRRHLDAVCDQILSVLPPNPVVVEIGCGSGHLLRALAERQPRGRYLGFDLSGHISEAGGSVEAWPILFEPDKHIAEFRPDMIISRHLLEHLVNPLGFIQHIGFACAWHQLDTRVFFEVPCIDRVFETHRTADFFYEHNSHFTVESFTRLLSRCTDNIEIVQRSYDDEVVFGIAQLGQNAEAIEKAKESLHFAKVASHADSTVSQQLDALVKSEVDIAVWGGTGKASAFINRYGLDAERFPLVVDSDFSKVGTFVPGTGQAIMAPTILNKRPVEVIVVATHWRARDIALEIETRGIQCAQVLLEHNGALVDYDTGSHPYRAQEVSLESARRKS